MKAPGVIVIIAIAGLGIGLSMLLQHSAAPAIQAAREEVRHQEWTSVLPTGSYDNQPLKHPLTLPSTPDETPVLGAFLATRQGQPCAVIFHSRSQGYAGAIDLLIGLSTEGRLMGIKVLEQHETPDIGGRLVTRPQWLNGFSGKSLDDPEDSRWAVKTDNGTFDQIAGATITSRATVKALHETLRYFDTHKVQLLAADKGAHP
ncbi:RnfABCDGE type electron transport complex subunit G [Pseudomonas sp. NPDC089734]|uniref:RnfABCDGE type electron transport complex subunit G n=1 Tax=Pseudomonas sp. NPDC089734 TaxID=3364469 RepID=UPI0037F3A32D